MLILYFIPLSNTLLSRKRLEMPLAERDVNAQKPPKPPKGVLAGHTAHGEENTSPNARFLAPTKSSSAKTTPPPRAPHSRSGRNTPNPTPQNSKLPRRPGAATLTPPTSKWSGRALDHNPLSNIQPAGSKSSPSLSALPSVKPLVSMLGS